MAPRDVTPRITALAIVAAMLAAGVSGCFILPVGVPPASVSGSVGGAIGKVQPREEGGTGQTESTATLQGRIAMAPLGFVPSLADRRFDVRAGYVVEYFPRDDIQRFIKHGAFVGGTYYPWVSDEAFGGLR